MTKTSKAFIRCSMLLCFVLFPLVGWAQAESSWMKPLSKCWSIETEGMTSIRLASDNEKTIILPLSSGSLLGVDILTGKQFWKTSVGNNYDSDLLVNDKEILLVSSKSSARLKNNSLSLVSVNADSGIASLLLSNNQTTSDQTFFVAATDQRMFLIDENGKVFAIDQKEKEKIWEKHLDLQLSAKPEIFGERLYLGTTNKSVVVLSSVDGIILNQIPIGIEPKSLNLIDKTLYVGDKLGGLRALRARNPKELWRTKTGGEITEIVDFGKLLLVSSNDNYEYAILKSTGKKIWKRKLAGRILGKAIIDNEILVIFTHGNNVALFVDLKDGAIVNRIVIAKDQYFVSAPLYLSGKLVTPTNRGVVAYSPDGCNKIHVLTRVIK